MNRWLDRLLARVIRTGLLEVTWADGSVSAYGNGGGCINAAEYDFARGLVDIDDNFFDERAHKLLFYARICGGCIPRGAQILREVQQRLAIMCSLRSRRWFMKPRLACSKRRSKASRSSRVSARRNLLQESRS